MRDHQSKREYFNRAYFKGEKFLCKIIQGGKFKGTKKKRTNFVDQNLVDANVMDQKLMDQYFRSQPKKYKV